MNRLFIAHAIQIRRMVGLAVAIACGQMKMSVVMDMLNAPEKYERLSSTKLETVSFCAPPYGLYLTDVQYHPTGRHPTGRPT